MAELTQADMVWNRACGGDPLRLLPGDRALFDMLRAHGLVMNGGVLHAVECLAATEVSAAEAGYRLYGVDGIASLFDLARTILERGTGLEVHEHRLDSRYADMIPSDSSLVERFKK